MKTEARIKELSEKFGGWWERECENGCDVVGIMKFDDANGAIPWDYENDIRFTCGSKSDSRLGGCGGRIIKNIWHKAIPKNACQTCNGTGRKK